MQDVTSGGLWCVILVRTSVGGWSTHPSCGVPTGTEWLLSLVASSEWSAGEWRKTPDRLRHDSDNAPPIETRPPERDLDGRSRQRMRFPHWGPLRCRLRDPARNVVALAVWAATRRKASPKRGIFRVWAEQRASAYKQSLGRSALVKLFGRLHDDPIRTRRRQAYEKHQWTKSREAARLGCGGLYQGLSGTPTLVVSDGTSREEVDGAFQRGIPLPVW